MPRKGFGGGAIRSDALRCRLCLAGHRLVAMRRLTAYRNGAKLIRLDLNEIDARMEAFGGNA